MGLRGEDGAPLLAGRRKLLTVLAYLARSPGKRVTRSELAALFWPIDDDVRARRSVRQALTELRRAVGPALDEQDDSVCILPASLSLDATELEAAAGAGNYVAVVELWQGDFLTGAESLAGDEFRGWLERERQRLRAGFAASVEQLTDQAEHRGAWESGLALTRAWTAAFPYDESAAARHVRLLALAGRRTEAAAARESFLRQLREELEVEPSAGFLRDTEAALAASAAGRSPGSGAAGRALLSPDLVGREAELDTLTALWESAVAGKPGLVLIEGDDGSGKSRLAEEFARWVRQREPRPVVLQARAFEAEQTRSWVLLRHLLAELAGAPGLAATPPEALATLGSLVPEIASRFRMPASSAPAAASERVTDAVARAIAEVAVERPVLLMTDDAHFADPESRVVLETLCRHPVPRCLLVLTTVPHGFAVADPGGLVRLGLRPLTEAQVERLLAGMADFLPADRRALATRLYAESGGNPLGTIELVTTL
ncbi:MAG TPA: AAA family ATPase, partial [Gemmatimonadales bacterium]|nr:AAA family ATPase [Gemmatimonadales bacterium]